MWVLHVGCAVDIMFLCFSPCGCCMWDVLLISCFCVFHHVGAACGMCCWYHVSVFFTMWVLHVGCAVDIMFLCFSPCGCCMWDVLLISCFCVFHHVGAACGMCCWYHVSVFFTMWVLHVGCAVDIMFLCFSPCGCCMWDVLLISSFCVFRGYVDNEFTENNSCNVCRLWWHCRSSWWRLWVGWVVIEGVGVVGLGVRGGGESPMFIIVQYAISNFHVKNLVQKICNSSALSMELCHLCIAQSILINTLRPRQNGLHLADDTFNRIFVNENVRISIKFSLKFDPNGPIKNIPALVQIMAWRRPGD